MIGDTIGITYNAVAKTLVRVNQDNYGADYFLDDSANQMKYYLKVRHTVPAKGKFGESHMMRLDIEYLDSTTGAVVRTASSWGVMLTQDNTQDLVSSQRLQAALLTALTPTNSTKMLGRES